MQKGYFQKNDSRLYTHEFNLNEELNATFYLHGLQTIEMHFPICTILLNKILHNNK